MRKKKQLRLLIILLLLLVLAIAGYIAAGRYTAKKAEEETEEAEETIALYPSGFDVENLASISYQVKSDTLTFVLKDDTWYYEKDEDFPVDQSSLTGMDSELLDLSASRKVTEDLDNASEYGLDEPSNEITLKDSSGNTFTLYVGDTNEGAGVTYVYTSEDQAVYTIDSEVAPYFTNSLLTVMSLEEVPVPDGTETYNKVSLKDEDGTLSIRQLSSLDYEEDYLGVMGYKAEDTRSDTSLEYGVTSEALDGFSSALMELSPTSCVAYKADEAQLEKYGLSSPAWTLTLDYTQQEAVEDDTELSGDDSETTDEETEEAEETETQYETVSYKQTIYIGVRDGDTKDSADYYYVTWKGTDNIYKIDATLFAGIVDLQKSDLTCMTPLAFQEDELESLTISYQGENYSYNNSVLEDEDAEDSSDASDDSEEDDDLFETISDAMENIYAEDFYPDGESAPEKTDKTLTIKVTLDRKKRNQITLTLTPYDTNTYALMVDGNPEYLLNKTEVSKLISELK